MPSHAVGLCELQNCGIERRERSPEISRFGSFVKPLWAMSGLQNYAQQVEVPKVPPPRPQA